MSKSYSSNLTQEQFELISGLIPAAKPSGRKRCVEIFSVLNAIFYVLCEGCRWRCLRQPEAGTLPGDFPNWQTVYTYFRNWRKDGTWVRIHEHLRQWVRVDNNRQPSPSQAIIDSQSVKSAALVSQAVGYDAGKKVKGRKRFLIVNTLGLVLRVLVTAASTGERQGGKQVLKKVKQIGTAVSRLNQIWVDSGFDGVSFDAVCDGLLPLDYTSSHPTHPENIRGLFCYLNVRLWSELLVGLFGLGD